MSCHYSSKTIDLQFDAQRLYVYCTSFSQFCVNYFIIFFTHCYFLKVSSVTQFSLTTWRARPNANPRFGTFFVIVEPAAT